MPKGRRPGNPDTKAEILDAARVEFTAGGYDGATIRGIASRADVDPSLVLHYFGSKEQLFVASLDIPVSPSAVMRSVFAARPESIGRALVTTMLTIWDDAGNRNQFVAVLRSATGEGPVHDTVQEFVHQSILAGLRRELEGPHADLRAALIASQLVGLLVGRYLLELEPLTRASVGTLAKEVGPVIDHYAALPETTNVG